MVENGVSYIYIYILTRSLNNNNLVRASRNFSIKPSINIMCDTYYKEVSQRIDLKENGNNKYWKGVTKGGDVIVLFLMRLRSGDVQYFLNYQ